MEKKIISVKFDDLPRSKEYAFATFIEVKVGDLVVVDTINGFTIGTVTNLTGALPDNKVLKEVVDVIDVSAFNVRKEKAEKMAKLKAKMDKRVKELQDIAVYEMLAEKDPELATMLTELKELN